MPSLDAHAYFQLTPLHSAAWRCKAEEVRQVLAAGGDVNARDTRGNTPLHLVAEPAPHSKTTDEQQIEVGKMLLDAGSDVNAKDNKQATPLHFAALWGRGTLVKLFLKHGSTQLSRRFEEIRCSLASRRSLALRRLWLREG